MLQQTQVAIVIPYFLRFIARFPTPISLAESDEQEVLRLWQGLGYYTRARNLRAAAMQIVKQFDGRVPQTVEELLSLPGVGRYTAGAVASIAFDQRAPILDGNVARVLSRIDCIKTDPRALPAREALWVRARQIMPRARAGDFNSAMMELGALICTPRSPKCLVCPVRAHCEAAAAGLQDQLPLRRKAPPTPLHRRCVICIRTDDRYLIEQRPPQGRWAGMWQFVTMKSQPAGISSDVIQTNFSLRTSTPRLLGAVSHALTHRRYAFEVYACAVKGAVALTSAPNDPPRRWVTLGELERFPLSRPQEKISEMIREPARQRSAARGFANQRTQPAKRQPPE